MKRLTWISLFLILLAACGSPAASIPTQTPEVLLPTLTDVPKPPTVTLTPTPEPTATTPPTPTPGLGSRRTAPGGRDGDGLCAGGDI